MNPFRFLFGKRKIGEWVRLDHEAIVASRIIKDYLWYYKKKIDSLQYFFLRLLDFENGHYDERKMKTNFVLHPGTGLEQVNYSKLNKHFFRLVKDRLNRALSLVRQENERAQDAVNEFEGIRVGLERLLERKRSEELSRMVKNFSKVHEVLGRQEGYLSSLEKSFSGFYKHTYTHAESIRRNYSLIEDDLKRVLASMREEGLALLGCDLGQDVSLWNVRLADAVRKSTLFSSLTGIEEVSSRMMALSKGRKVLLYHATENREKLFPLRESAFRWGFFGCTGNKRFALVIKARHTTDMGARMTVREVLVPFPVFHELFQRDRTQGRPGDELSEEAYANSYVLPVSNFPKFNWYHNAGLISEV